MTGVTAAELGSHPFLAGMPAEHVALLAGVADLIAVPPGARLFEEGGRASRIWLIRSGLVALDLHVPGHAALILETVGGGEVLGLSWICPPYEWQFGGLAIEATEAFELDSAAVIEYCDNDAALGYQFTKRMMAVAAQRLHATRIRLLDLYAPPGQRTVLA